MFINLIKICQNEKVKIARGPCHKITFQLQMERPGELQSLWSYLFDWTPATDFLVTPCVVLLSFCVVFLSFTEWKCSRLGGVD